jgi:predicted porin
MSVMSPRRTVCKKIVCGIGNGLPGLFASVGLVANACAADLDTFFKAPPVLPDLTWNGVTVIGAVDVSGQYERFGASYAGPAFSPLSAIAPMSTSPRWFFASNQSIQSYVGLKVDEKISSDLSLIARLEVGFNPTTGALPDGLKTLQQANGVPLAQQGANGDSSRAGQILNGEAWVGFEEKRWGTLHVGRNSNVTTDMLAAYDPLLSYGFSLYGFVGIYAGQGSAETARIDNSVKYLNTFGPFRTELMYGAPDTNVKEFYQGSFGIVRPNFSIDLVGGHTNDSVSAGSLSGSGSVHSPLLGGRVFDTDMYGVNAKYVFDVGGRGLQDPSNSRVALSGGYNRIEFSNPTDGGFSPGHKTIGGYELGPALSTTGSIGAGIVNYAYTGGNRIVESYFIAGRYQYNEHWSVAVSYYRFNQNSFGFGLNDLPGIVAASYSKISCSSSSFTNCSGVSFRVDYDWNKNIKLYAGVEVSQVTGGLSFGYINTYTFDPTLGLRCSF